MSAETALSEARERCAALIQPLAEGNGVGIDVSYDETFEAIRAEVEKLTAVDSGPPNWEKIAAGAREITAEKSRDFRVLVYFAAAEFQSRRPPRVLDALVVLLAAVERHWGEMFPSASRPRARANLLVWLTEIGPGMIDTIEPRLDDRDVCDAAVEAYRTLDSALGQNLVDAMPNTSALRDALVRLAGRVPEPEREATSDASGGSTSSSSDAIAGGAAPVAVVDIESAGQAVEQACITLVQAGQLFRRTQPMNPTGYVLERLGRWLPIDGIPTQPNGRSFFFAPSSFVVDQMAGLREASDWAGLLEMANDWFDNAPTWLDVQNQIWVALQGQGSEYDAARQAIVTSLRWFLGRIPEVLTGTFQGGEPMANAATTEWIKAYVLAGQGSGGPSTGSSFEEKLTEARAKASSGQLMEAVSLLTVVAAAAPSPRERFRVLLASAQMCVAAQQFGVARAQLEGLDNLAESHRLSDWDPELCAELYSALFEACRGVNQNAQGRSTPEDERREHAAFAKLAQISPATALRVAGS